MQELRLSKGFYTLVEEQEICGLAFAMGYVPEEKNFQITILLGNVSLGVGYIF